MVPLELIEGMCWPMGAPLLPASSYPGTPLETPTPCTGRKNRQSSNKSDKCYMAVKAQLELRLTLSLCWGCKVAANSNNKSFKNVFR